jgi:hypothetical protein
MRELDTTLSSRPQSEAELEVNSADMDKALVSISFLKDLGLVLVYGPLPEILFSVLEETGFPIV